MIPSFFSATSQLYHIANYGLINKFKALYEKSSKCAEDTESCLEEQKYEWNFGYVSYSGETESLLEMLSLPGHVLHTTHFAYLPNTVDVTLTAKEPFHNISNCCFKCLPVIKFQLVLNRLKTN